MYNLYLHYNYANEHHPLKCNINVYIYGNQCNATDMGKNENYIKIKNTYDINSEILHDEQLGTHYVKVQHKTNNKSSGK